MGARQVPGPLRTIRVSPARRGGVTRYGRKQTRTTMKPPVWRDDHIMPPPTILPSGPPSRRLPAPSPGLTPPPGGPAGSRPSRCGCQCPAPPAAGHPPRGQRGEEPGLEQSGLWLQPAEPERARRGGPGTALPGPAAGGDPGPAQQAGGPVLGSRPRVTGAHPAARSRTLRAGLPHPSRQSAAGSVAFARERAAHRGVGGDGLQGWGSL